MPFDPTTAAIRFGTGLSPLVPPPDSAADMLARLTGPDLAAALVPLPTTAQVVPSFQDFFALNVARRDARGTDGEAAANAAFAAAQRASLDVVRDALTGTMARGVATADGLRERLTRFWADHFTVLGRNALNRHLVSPFVEDTIRPQVATGRFADLLRAVALHPMMITYLDQNRSIGPGSPAGLRTGNGLNENFARELIELHTLGVGGPYTQTDVRELAELLTGLSWNANRGVEYVPNYAEPGAETVLGQTFSPDASLTTVTDALDALARHPATARHIATKLAVHFVSDTPDPDLIDALTATFTATDGALLPLVETLLAHPASWAPARAKVKPPFDFLTSALRALAVPPGALTALDTRGMRHILGAPLTAMGQSWEAPGGPDGWPEAAADWVTPQSMAARISWAFAIPARLLGDLPDPRDFVLTALGAGADAAVVFAASAAETPAEGIGVILSSAAFQRR